MEQVKIVDSFQEHGFIDITWEAILTGVTSYRLYKKDILGTYELLFSLPTNQTNIRYTLPPDTCGAAIDLALAAYDAISGEESGLSVVVFNTIPNPPANVRFIYAKDNKVEMAWDAPTNRSNIRGYVIERRRSSESEYTRIDIASTNRYIDIGSDFAHPISENTYDYRISALSYLDVASPMIENTIAVKKDSVVDVNTMKNLGTSFEHKSMRFRIKTVGSDGETAWFVRNGMLCDSLGQPWHEVKSRITVKTIDPGHSMTVKNQTILSSIIFNQTEPQRFRLRAIATDGAESNAILTTAQIIMLKIPFIVNNDVNDLASTRDRKLISRSVW